MMGLLPGRTWLGICDKAGRVGIKREKEVRFRGKYTEAATKTGADLAKTAYLAGFFDGEGCISFHTYKYNQRYNNVWQISAKNVDIEPINLLIKAFGGLLYVQEPATVNQRPCFEWRVTGLKARHALLMMLPFLTVKREQAKIAIKLLDYYRNPNTNNVPERDILLKELTVLKHKREDSNHDP